MYHCHQNAGSHDLIDKILDTVTFALKPVNVRMLDDAVEDCSSHDFIVPNILWFVKLLLEVKILDLASQRRRINFKNHVMKDLRMNAGRLQSRQIECQTMDKFTWVLSPCVFGESGKGVEIKKEHKKPSATALSQIMMDR